ncbi:MAG: lantibiotic biosynthesis protein [Solirubrobacteraceae bacterium]|nr:lantibiotic biosynthesis protein [Solirubrobacteraceae bacterium]
MTAPAARGWRSVLDPDRQLAALTVARDVARRSTDPERVAAALAAAPEQTNFPKTLRWTAHGIAEGDAGLAVLCACMDAHMPDEDWDAIGHGFLATAARAVERAPRLPTGLFSGLSGVAFAAASLSRGGTRYQRLLGALDGGLAPRAAARGIALQRRRKPGGVGEFDAISGATGTAAYLLVRDPHAALPQVLRGLVALAEPGDGLPRWFTPRELLGDESVARLYPHGNLNCGLAHGIPGPLAVLALALLEGHEGPGHVAAVKRLAAWVAEQRIEDGWGVTWPSAVPVGVPASSAPLPTRNAWCYGSPGVARALWLAGNALDDGELRDLAVEAMLAVSRRPVSERRIDSPTFCHGVAGLLQIVLRFANDTGLPEFSSTAAELVDQLLEAYEPDRPLGYASLEPGSNSVDRAGLLDGAPGVAMALLAAATDVEPTWDRLFLLS